MSKKHTIEEMNKIISYKNIYVDNYDGALKPVTAHCKKCGYTWITQANVLKSLKCGCPKCQKKAAADKLRLTWEDFSKKHNNLNLYWDILDLYTGAGKKCHFKCKKCGYIRYTDPNTVARHPGCPNCNKTRKLTNDEYLKLVRKYHGDEYIILSEYTGKNNYITIKHTICGNIFKTRAGNFVRHGKYKPCGCPYCSKNNTRNSSGAMEVKNFLINNGIFFESEVKFDDCKDKNPLPFDFGVYDKNTKCLLYLIEYDGEQHFKYSKKGKFNEEKFKIIKKHDRIKNEYCKNNGIPLLRIAYNEPIVKKLEDFIKMCSTTIESQ